jgi:hypothetical protein
MFFDKYYMTANPARDYCMSRRITASEFKAKALAMIVEVERAQEPVVINEARQA